MKYFILFFVLVLTLIGARWLYVQSLYPQVLKDISIQHQHISKGYNAQTTAIARKKAASFLETTLIDEILPFWLGTPWTFQGDSKKPLVGSIACGAFVENTLRDLGFDMPEAMSMQPSEYIIKNLVPESEVQRFSRVSIDKFLKSIQQQGQGIYLVGLDTHIGYLVYQDNSFRFIHSLGGLGVINENALNSVSLKKSKYRVSGKLFGKRMTEQWIAQQRIPMRYHYQKGRQI